MARLLVRTALANLRSRPLQTALVALILAAASATLALAVSLRAGAADPYEKIARATNAADVHCRGRGDLAALAHAPGVKAAEGPFRLARRARPQPAHELQPRARGRRRAPAAHRPPEADRRPLAVRRAGRARARPPDRAQSRRPRRPAPDRPAARPAHRADRGRDRGLGRPRPLVGERGHARRAAARRRSPSGACSSSSSPTATRAAPSSTTCAGATRPISSTPTTGATIARRSPTGPRRRPSCWAARAWPPCSRSASSSPTRSAGGSSRSRRDIGLLKAAGFTPGGVTALFVVENLVVAGAASIVGTALGIALSPLLLAADRQPARAPPRRAACARSRWRRASSASSPWSASSPRCRRGARGGSACSRRSPWGARA